MSELTVPFAGQEFRVADSIGLMPLMQFAHIAKGGTDSNDLEGLAAMYDLLEQCIADDEWARFKAHAVKSKADGDVLMGVVKATIQALSGRPTSRPSDSSGGPTIIGENSEGDSSLQVVRRLERQGRPDLALMVQMAQEARSSAA